MLLVSNLAGKANNINFARVNYRNNLLSVRGALFEAIIQISYYCGSFMHSKMSVTESVWLRITLSFIGLKSSQNEMNS